MINIMLGMISDPLQITYANDHNGACHCIHDGDHDDNDANKSDDDFDDSDD